MTGRVKSLRKALAELLDEVDKNVTPNEKDGIWKAALEQSRAALALPPDEADDEMMDDYQAMQEQNARLRASLEESNRMIRQLWARAAGARDIRDVTAEVNAQLARNEAATTSNG